MTNTLNKLNFEIIMIDKNVHQGKNSYTLSPQLNIICHLCFLMWTTFFFLLKFPLETKGILVQSYISFFSVSYGNGIVQSWTFIDDLKINIDLSLQ